MKDTAESLISEIRYQYPLGVTTLGPCSTEGCDNTARGSRRCAQCLTERLAQITEAAWAYKFHAQTAGAHETACRMLALESEE